MLPEAKNPARHYDGPILKQWMEPIDQNARLYNTTITRCHWDKVEG